MSNNREAMKPYDGMMLRRSDELPDDEMLILTLTPVGSKKTRYVAISAGQYGLAINEIRAGCHILTKVALARHAAEQAKGAEVPGR